MPANTSHSRGECPTVQRVPRDWVIAAAGGNHRAGSVSQAGATPTTVLDPLQHRIDPGVEDVAPTCGASIERLSGAQADNTDATRRRLVIAAIAVVDPHRTRSHERRVGNEWVCPCTSPFAPDHAKKKNTKITNN